MSTPTFTARRRIVRALRRFNRACERSAAGMLFVLAILLLLVWR